MNSRDAAAIAVNPTIDLDAPYTTGVPFTRLEMEDGSCVRACIAPRDHIRLRVRLHRCSHDLTVDEIDELRRVLDTVRAIDQVDR